MLEICLYLHNHELPNPKNAILPITCPLYILSVIKYESYNRASWNKTACCVKDGVFEEDDQVLGKYSMIFTNLETLVQNDNWRGMLKSMQRIVVDEAHVLPKFLLHQTQTILPLQFYTVQIVSVTSNVEPVRATFLVFGQFSPHWQIIRKS